jgi:hypothetical protein
MYYCEPRRDSQFTSSLLLNESNLDPNLGQKGMLFIYSVYASPEFGWFDEANLLVENSSPVSLLFLMTRKSRMSAKKHRAIYSYKVNSVLKGAQA